MSQALKSLEKDLKNLANPEKAKILSGFFKTGKWQYGEWDIFLGIIVPEQRKLVKMYWKELALPDIDRLLESKYHEYRLVGLLILVAQFEETNSSSLRYPRAPRGTKQSSLCHCEYGDESFVDNSCIRDPSFHSGWQAHKQKTIFDFYLSKTSRINNWDLVDLSADRIVGGYLLSSVIPSVAEGSLRNSTERDSSTALRSGRNDNPQLSILATLAHSTNLWEQRIAILSTFAFIKKGIHEPTFEIAKILLNHKHDLIHKAVGWMLREVGKRISEEIEETFLREFASQMPRTMLRYAIERFEEKKRLKYLQLKLTT